MAYPGLSPDLVQQTIALVTEHGSVLAAAKASGISRNTLQHRYVRCKQLLDLPDQPPTFEVPELPTELPTAEELIARRSKQFSRKRDAKDARHLIPVQVKIDGPFGVAIPGDPHLDDDGTDIDLVREHVELFRKHDAILPIGIGDNHNNWIGRLARLYGQQSLSAAEGWVLVEWYIRAVRWLALVAGNHDLWSGAGDPTIWMSRAQRVTYESNGVRLGLTTPGNRVIRINARHDFSGHSQWNTVHGPSKAAQMGWRDHILVAGHKHTSGLNILRDPSSGLISYAIRTGSYKTYDRYAEEKGLPNQTFSVCPVMVIRPAFADDDNRLLQYFPEPGTAAEFLKWVRGRKSER
jgi:hypothetical protein